MPFIVASQTIPILAIAPMVVVGLGAIEIFGWTPSDWQRVSVIAAYLTFFPVTINTVRGLSSVDPHALQLMRSYAAGNWSILWKLRVPTSLPYVFAALKVSATASVVGAIVGELPSSIQEGLGGKILNFNQYYSTGPENLWATNIVAAMLGVCFFLAIVGLEKLVVHRAPEQIRVTENAVVSIRGLSKVFPRGDVSALQGIDLEVGQGEFISLIGPSGCGKSTLLRIIGDLVTPSSGEITVNGKTPHQARARP